MSGHSKWKTNKGKKGAADAKRGATFTKIIKELVVVARDGGGNPDSNPRLRAIMQKAKEANMPSDNIKMAIKRGTGELPGVVYEAVMYEAYGPGGVAILIDSLTDNKNRTTAEIRNIMSKKGGNMAGAGSVSWMFTQKGYISVAKESIKEDDLMNIVLDAGAEDMKHEEDTYEIFTAIADLENVKQALTDKGIKWIDAELTMIPSSTIKVAGHEARQVLSLVETLEEHDDVQQVYANFDIPDEILNEDSSDEK
ncbi:MAG: YebC/PmpR family DNA-binding transcriptional regulator [Candidatus Omnitrophica bacterium]|jgi:YebC/PmpR family DNA-binding regulatory protein|nr:YebC/PmpR family DNA-binding transcriptional regulator [Candidatus Omnitrophota bacterium]MDD3274806.1 YebC/PmpR family DNA-binding transcriptional regulator [Candidatus Omnitrophota bacterium]MDD5077670.1 YebC/PmpR family DNA-binding transcriptional regulator [Candidatus Omnitrophota bacterium]MDD5725144.1 YebC/PmpR family DNA-binding transcriptional regulator [Candidatus Omnitrophota bacterium]